MKKLSIVIPCYNEAHNIPLLLERFERVIDDYNIEVVLVDNGSIDGSADVLKKLLPRYPFVTMVKVGKNQGYGFGILTGLKAATGDFLGWTHADMQTDPFDVINAYRLLQAHYFAEHLFVKGARKGRSFFDQFFTLGMSCFESLYLSTPLWDINGQPTIFHRGFFEKWQNPPFDFSIDLYAYFMAKDTGLKVLRFKVVFAERLYGQASNQSFRAKCRLIKRTLLFSRQLKKGFLAPQRGE